MCVQLQVMQKNSSYRMSTDVDSK
uniref:Uncharacterized protein n=1 Tax=Arundo donax TaxID=35708 RepID=A0A0A9ALE1_ARUDO